MLLFQKFSVSLLEFFSGVLLVRDLTLGSSRITYKQRDYQRGNQKNYRSEKRHVVTQDIYRSIFVELVSISEC